MSDPYFFCYRCRQHKPFDRLAEHKSPSGRPCCKSCDTVLVKGKSTTRATKKLRAKNIEWLADHCI